MPGVLYCGDMTKGFDVLQRGMCRYGTSNKKAISFDGHRCW